MNLYSPRILAFCGPQLAGKSEAAKAIAKQPGWVHRSFADTIYNMMSQLLGTNARLLPKNQPLDELCGKTLRQALQTLGTEWGRDLIGRELWLKAMQRKLEVAHKQLGCSVVIDDLRFANEQILLQSLGAVIVRVYRPGLDLNTIHSHPSESEWLDFPSTINMRNDGSVDVWRVKALHFSQNLPA